MGMDPFTLMAGASLVSGVMGADASSSAASKQAGAANNATAAQKAMFDKTVQLEQPYNDAGVAAQQRLSYLLGVGPSSYGYSSPQSTSPVSQFNGVDHDQITGGVPQAAPHLTSFGDVIRYGLTHPQGQGGPTPQAIGPMQGPVSGPMGGPGDAGYGSLNKPFGMDDFQLDPGIQFQLKYGNQALQNSQAAQDGVMSGSALKSLIGYNQDYAGQGYQSAFDRYMANKKFTYGALSDIANRGQAAAGNNVNAAGSFSSGIASTIQGAGNASAAGTVGMANALTGGLSGAGNAYMLRSLINPASTQATPGVSGANLDLGLGI